MAFIEIETSLTTHQIFCLNRLPFAQTIEMQVQLIVVSLVTEWYETWRQEALKCALNVRQQRSQSEIVSAWHHTSSKTSDLGSVTF